MGGGNADTGAGSLQPCEDKGGASRTSAGRGWEGGDLESRSRRGPARVVGAAGAAQGHARKSPQAARVGRAPQPPPRGEAAAGRSEVAWRGGGWRAGGARGGRGGVRRPYIARAPAARRTASSRRRASGARR